MAAAALPRCTVSAAARLVRQGKVIAFPTETAYGLAVDPLDRSALARLFAAKGRPPDKPVLVLVASETMLAGLVREIPAPYRPLMALAWPGPLTLVFPARPGLPSLLTGGTDTIGVRISSHPLAQQLVAAVGGPVTATSANRSGEEPARSAAEVEAQLAGRIHGLVDGGATAATGVSTIVGLDRRGRLRCVRPGAISFAAVREIARSRSAAR